MTLIYISLYLQSNRQKRSLDKTAKLRGDALLRTLSKIGKELVSIRLAIQRQGGGRRGKGLTRSKLKNKKDQLRNKKGKSKKARKGRNMKKGKAKSRKGKNLKGKKKNKNKKAKNKNKKAKSQGKNIKKG